MHQSMEDQIKKNLTFFHLYNIDWFYLLWKLFYKKNTIKLNGCGHKNNLNIITIKHNQYSYQNQLLKP